MQKFKRQADQQSQAKSVPTNSELWQSWQFFWNSKLGQAITVAEQLQLQPWLEEQRGYDCLNLSSLLAPPWLASCPIKHQICWRPDTSSANHASCLIADPAALPLPNDSIDLVLLHHILELAAKPHEVLREAARVTLPKGELWVVGFNPSSLLGLSRYLPSSWQAQNTWVLHQAQLVGLAKLLHWIEFLDLQLIDLVRFWHRPAWSHRYNLEKCAGLDTWLMPKNLPGGGVYLLRLRKLVGSPLRPDFVRTKPSWLTARPVSLPTRTSLKTEK